MNWKISTETFVKPGDIHAKVRMEKAYHNEPTWISEKPVHYFGVNRLKKKISINP